MHSSTLLALMLSASTALAMPSPPELLRLRAVDRKGGSVSDVALPASSLPGPAPGLVLKYVALGVGTQNYTCKATPNSASAAPVSNGAKANLFDAVPLLSSGPPPMKANLERILPRLALSMSTHGITPDKWPAPVGLRQIGTHFFTPTLQPTFALDSASPPAVIQVKKVANIPAPPDSCPGNNGEVAVDWLDLVDNGLGLGAGGPLSGGAVYRVETAGGSAPKTCQGQSGDVIVQYAAEYFFYGPGP